MKETWVLFDPKGNPRLAQQDENEAWWAWASFNCENLNNTTAFFEELKQQGWTCVRVEPVKEIREGYVSEAQAINIFKNC